MTSQRSTKDLRIVFAAQDITKSISDVSPFPRRFGGMADIHQGVWASDSGNQKVTVAIKFICSGDDELDKTLRRHRREIRVWHGIDHPNILRLVGLYWGSGRKLPAMVSVWCQHTNLRNYVKELLPGPEAMAQKYSLLEQIISGLDHLHSQSPPIVHGDLKGDNILLSADGIPKICDFGLSKIIEVTTETSTRVRGTCRWMAPELLLEEKPVSAPGDIWAHACVIVEVLTGLLPYSDIQKEAGVIVAQSRGQIPTRPADASDACWNLALKCVTAQELPL
ncbi:kinase-like protein [Exidia glandulosa HHB12029]|uniref:Kinase-like protein n=1 Tax=Exidia glandulosa HHB12029 TaxID=1314781 RepID=A0A165KM45_EXIGL|nr:kinase-like protein [Exidia glandulosa HHB12029]